MIPDQLYLIVESCNCRCGHKWTTSYPILSATDGSLGGTPTPDQEYKLPVVAIHEADRHFDHCFRCVSIVLPRAFTFERLGDRKGGKQPQSTIADLLT